MFFSCKTATLWPDLQVCWGSSPHLWFCACKAATLAHELLVSMGPSPHLWFLHAKQRLLVQNNKSLWVPDMSCRFVHANSVPSIRITSLHVSQPSSEVIACKTATFGSEKQISMGPRYHLLFCAFNTSWLVPETLVSLGPKPYLWFLHSKQRLLDSNNKSLWVPDITCRFVHAKQCD